MWTDRGWMAKTGRQNVGTGGELGVTINHENMDAQLPGLSIKERAGIANLLFLR